MKTLFLMPSNWDLALDASGNIAVAESTYQVAQDIASACRVITGDMYYDKTAGIPYLDEILGKGRYSLSLYTQQLQSAALTVPSVTSALIDMRTINERVLSGMITFTTTNNEKGVLAL